MSYSPKIKEELVRKLYLLKHSSKPKKPIDMPPEQCTNDKLVFSQCQALAT